MFDGMKSIRRRACMKNSLAASAISDAAIGQGRGANDRVQIAIIGCGGRVLRSPLVWSGRAMYCVRRYGIFVKAAYPYC